MRRKKSFEDVAVDLFAYTFITLLALSTVLPFLNVLSKSVSEEWAVISGKVGIYPVGFQLGTLHFVITSKQFINSFTVSVLITGVGAVASLLMTAIAAYPLSKRHLPGVKGVTLLYVFTMLFSGGMIPNYLLMKSLNLINNLAVLILPAMISVFNMLVVKNYFESLPESLEESAKLDGASNMTILFKIMIPLSTPVLATVSLFYAVHYWNDYFGPMLYISKPSLKTLQLYLREIVMEANSSSAGMDRSTDDLQNISPEGVRAATIIASTVPILLVYPYLQKYFIKGILIGSVKG
mgnify:CR=1 FL=1